MSELVRKGDDIAERSVEIGEYAALMCAGNTAVECTADLAFTRVEVDPRFVKRGFHHVVQFGVKLAEDIQKVLLRVLNGVFFVSRSHGCEQVMPRESAFVTEQFRLRTEILVEHGHVLFHRGEERVEGFPLHPGGVQGFRQRRFVAAQFAFVEHLQLDAVERKRHGFVDLFARGEFRFVCGFSHGGIGIVGKIADGGKRDSVPVVIDGEGACQTALQITPRGRTGDTHFREQGFFLVGEEVSAVLFDVGEKIAEFFQCGLFCDHGVDVSLCDAALDEGIGSGSHAELRHELSLNACGVGIPCVCGIAEICVDEQLFHDFVHLHAAVEIGSDDLGVGHRTHVCGKIVHLCDKGVEGIDIVFECGIVESVVEDGEIPGSVGYRHK